MIGAGKGMNHVCIRYRDVGMDVHESSLRGGQFYVPSAMGLVRDSHR